MRFRTFCVLAGIVVSLVSLTSAPSFAIEIKRMTLDGGATLLVSEQHQLPMVTMAIAFDAGARRDPAGKEGIAALTAHCLTEGTKDLTQAQFSEKVDFMGSALAIAASSDYAQAGFTSLSKYTADTLHLLAQTLTNPGLRDADIIRKRDEQVADLMAADQEPGYVAGITFDKLLFGDGPYGHPAEGVAKLVAKLTPDDVRAFFHDHYKLGGAVIAVVGDIRADDIKAALEHELSALQGSVAAQAEPSAAAVAAGLHSTMIDRSVQQANIILGFAGIARTNPDYYKLQVMNYILGGGGFASRLVKVVRSKAGLAYSVGSAIKAGKFPGPFEVELQTKNQSANEAIKLVLGQLREIQEQPVSDAELESAKKFLIGGFPLRLDRQSAIASFLLQIELYKLGLDYVDQYPKLIAEVTKEDVQQVARQYLHPDAAILVAVANQSEAAINVASLQAAKAN